MRITIAELESAQTLLLVSRCLSSSLQATEPSASPGSSCALLYRRVQGGLTSWTITTRPRVTNPEFVEAALGTSRKRMQMVQVAEVFEELLGGGPAYAQEVSARLQAVVSEPAASE
jgi:hypothetical protein